MSNPVAPPTDRLSGLAERFCCVLPSTGTSPLVSGLHTLAARAAGLERGAVRLVAA